MSEVIPRQSAHCACRGEIARPESPLRSADCDPQGARTSLASHIGRRGQPLVGNYWLIPLDRAWAVRSARGIETEGFDCTAAARHWIEEREAEEADELAALADFEADLIREAA